MKSMVRWMTIFGLLAVMIAAALSFAGVAPVQAHAAAGPVLQTTPQPPVEMTPPAQPPAQTTVIVPNTGGADNGSPGMFVGSWWVLVLIGVLLIGLIIGLLARGTDHTHID